MTRVTANISTSVDSFVAGPNDSRKNAPGDGGGGDRLHEWIDDQAEVDYFWEALTADDGEERQCRWLKDRYGVSWQLVPTVLPEPLRDEDAETASRVVEATLQVQKIDVEALRQRVG